MSDPHLQQLNAAMERRRLSLGLKYWRDLAAAAGVSYETLRALRKGEGTPAEGTLHGLERALEWESGSILTTLAGGSPVEVGQASAVDPAVDGLDTGERSPASKALEDILAAMQVELRGLNEKIDRLSDRLPADRDNDGEGHNSNRKTG